jgi:hypothetical protein
MGDAPASFRFYSRLDLAELTGVKASTVEELLEHLRSVGGACIYHHTHHFLQRHHYLSPEPTNDFAFWVSEMLGDKKLGEELASVDIMSYDSIRALRTAIIEVLEEALRSRPRIRQLAAPEGQEFSFLKSMSFVFPTDFQVSTLKEFVDALRLVSLNSIYYHMFDARLRLERATNDFSNWLANALGKTQLALRIARLDPYTLTGEGLRAKLVRLIDAEPLDKG